MKATSTNLSGKLIEMLPNITAPLVVVYMYNVTLCHNRKITRQLRNLFDVNHASSEISLYLVRGRLDHEGRWPEYAIR